MTDQGKALSPLMYARVAGVLYLIIIVFGISSEVFIRSSLIVHDDPATTATNIQMSSMLFRTGFAADTVMLLADVAIAVLFYVLLKPVGRTLALLAAVFRLAQAAILGANLLNYYAALMILSGAGYMAAFDATQLHALAMLMLEMHGHGYDLGLIFFGVSNLILGYLVIKSSHFPTVFGYGLQAAGAVYLAGSFTLFLLPAYITFVEPAYIVPLVAEVSFALWLLFKGVRKITS